jgi:hypothetical protein
MSADFILSFSNAFLDRASQSVFPTIQPRLSRSERVSNLNLTIAWTVPKAPQFQLTGGGGGQMFTLTMPLAISITPDNGSKQTAESQAIASCRATITGNGAVHFGLVDLSFSATDPFVQAALNAKKTDIASQVNGFVSAIAINLAIVNGVTFAGYAFAIETGQAAAAGGLTMPVLVPPTPALTTDFAVEIGEPLVQYIVATQFWNTVDKTYSTSGATVHLNSYSARLFNGQVILQLHLSGDFSIGDAHWDISIDTVTATLNLAVGADNTLRITGGSVSRPGVSLKPANVWAWLATIAASVLGAVTTAILNEVISGKVQDAINGKLARPLFQVPVLGGSIEGISVSITPVDLAVRGVGNQLFLSGNGQVSAH